MFWKYCEAFTYFVAVPLFVLCHVGLFMRNEIANPPLPVAKGTKISEESITNELMYGVFEARGFRLATFEDNKIKTEFNCEILGRKRFGYPIKGSGVLIRQFNYENNQTFYTSCDNVELDSITGNSIMSGNVKMWTGPLQFKNKNPY